MLGIPSDKWFKLPAAELTAMRQNFAETFGTTIDRVTWRERRSKKCATGRMFFLALKPRKTKK